MSQFGFTCPKRTLSMCMFGPCNSAHALGIRIVFVDKPTYIPTYIYHAKSLLNTPQCGVRFAHDHIIDFCMKCLVFSEPVIEREN